VSAPAAPCTQAIILAGGDGKRMRPITSLTPKSVVPLVERPFVTYILDDLVRHGVEHAIVSGAHPAEATETALDGWSAHGLRITHVREVEPLGTAGAIAACACVLDDGPFFVLNGDVLSDVDLTAMAAAHATRDRAATICLTRVDDPRRYGVVLMGDDDSVVEYLEKPSTWLGPALVNAGTYVLEREVLDLLPRGLESSMELGLLPRLAAIGTLYGHIHTGYWRDVGTPESYLQAHFDVLAGTPRTTAWERLDERRRFVAATASVGAEARLVPPVWVGGGAVIDGDARVGPNSVIGAGAWVRTGARVSESVLQAGCVAGESAEIERSVLVRGASVGDGARVVGAILGEASRVGTGARPAAGTRLRPNEVVPDDVAFPAGWPESTPCHPPAEPARDVVA